MGGEEEEEEERRGVSDEAPNKAVRCLMCTEVGPRGGGIQPTRTEKAHRTILSIVYISHKIKSGDNESINTKCRGR